MFILKKEVQFGSEIIKNGAKLIPVQADNGDCFVVSPSHIEGLPNGDVPIYDRNLFEKKDLEFIH